MGIILKPIDVVDDITQEEFMEKYLKPRRPVVIKIWQENGLLIRSGPWSM